jgi:hypothetical protein
VGSKNNVVIDLPPVDHADAKNIYGPTVAASLVRAVVAIWAPSDVTWVSHDLREAQGVTIGEVAVGWATYLSRERVARVGRLPDDVKTEAIGDGLLITVVDDPIHVPLDRVIAVRQALGPALLPDLYEPSVEPGRTCTGIGYGCRCASLH